MGRWYTLLGAATALCCCWCVAAAAGVTVTVGVDTTVPVQPFVHKWKRSFGSGHAALTLRKDWRAHLQQAATELGLTGVR